MLIPIMLPFLLYLVSVVVGCFKSAPVKKINKKIRYYSEEEGIYKIKR